MTVRTVKGRWCVVAEWHGSERVIFRPDPTAHAIAQIRACVRFKEEHS